MPPHATPLQHARIRQVGKSGGREMRQSLLHGGKRVHPSWSRPNVINWRRTGQSRNEFNDAIRHRLVAATLPGVYLM